MADGDDGGLFNIAISDSEDDTTGAKKERGGQTEEEFQALKATYRPKIENGETWKTVKLPLSGDATKPQVQGLLHAVEELYFFRRYEEGARLARGALDSDIDGTALDAEHKRLIARYEAKCLQRLERELPASGAS